MGRVRNLVMLLPERRTGVAVLTDRDPSPVPQTLPLSFGYARRSAIDGASAPLQLRMAIIAFVRTETS